MSDSRVRGIVDYSPARAALSERREALRAALEKIRRQRFTARRLFAEKTAPCYTGTPQERMELDRCWKLHGEEKAAEKRLWDTISEINDMDYQRMHGHPWRTPRVRRQTAEYEVDQAALDEALTGWYNEDTGRYEDTGKLA